MNRMGAIFTDEEDTLLGTMWNEGWLLFAIADRLGRTTKSILHRASILRRKGIFIQVRNGVLQGNDRSGYAPVVPLHPFEMPDHMRFEDDPAAISDRTPVYMPTPSSMHQSAASSLLGGVLKSMSGKNGART